MNLCPQQQPNQTATTQGNAMTESQTQAIVSLSLLAAFADGDKHERERAEIKRIAEGLSRADGVHLPTLVQDVLMKRVTVASVAETLNSPQASHEARQLAYEMVVCVCDADGEQSPVERTFLAGVRSALGLDPAQAKTFDDAAESLAAAPMAAAVVPSAGVPASVVVAAPASQPGGARPQVDETELEKAILDAAITNGALELLPETLSTMAIIPLQMRLVYRIGQAYGYELDRGHIKDFLATAGVGLTSQYLEQAGRKLIGGLLGKMAGGLMRGVGNQAVSSGMSFVATYALGHVAQRYYAGGRTLSAQTLKAAYASITDEGKNLQARYLPAIREKAGTLDIGKVMAMVRGR
ncbi:MAG: DUF533 domain-containing protein [Polaromonas sp.]|nr:DUF533 domain-containing protein [Polaromonas sp.]